jgi:hypothetical protein
VGVNEHDGLTGGDQCSLQLPFSLCRRSPRALSPFISFCLSHYLLVVRRDK